MTQIPVYIGSYTAKLPFVDGKSEGICLYHLDQQAGTLTYISQTTGLLNPTYQTLHPNGRYLYSVSEGLGDEAVITAFEINAETGFLTYLNEQSAHGDFPCHLNVDQTGQHLIIANYGSGSVVVYPLAGNGHLGKRSQFIQHEGGTMVNPERQEGPHAHCIQFDANNNFVFVADLGLDKLMIYQLDRQQGQLQPAAQPWIEAAPGAGPRHLAWHPSGDYLFLINELGSTIMSLAYDKATGRLQTLDTVSTLPENFAGESTCAAVRVAPSGKFVYGSNRGHDSIASFTFDANTGRLTSTGHTLTQGQTPRDFNIDPSETFLLAANQDTDTVVTYRINPDDGTLQKTGVVSEIMTPVCLTFAG
ncbi:MAG: lactonase family protein [Chloroflexota bacterium]